MMPNVHQALSLAILKLLRPLVTILLRNGIAYGTFAELAKKVYVDVAFEQFGVLGKKQTVSHVSALTGLTRKEVRRLLDLKQPGDLGAAERYNRAVRVISGWLQDMRYLDAHGRPTELALDADDPPSFATLVKDYSGDVPTQAMLSVLVASGSVEEHNGRVRLVRPAYVPSNDPVDKIHILGTDVGELIATIDHNLKSEGADLFFQRKVSNDNVRSDVLPKFRKISAAKAQALLEDLDGWLSEHEAKDKLDGPGVQPKQVSLGIYYFEQDASEENNS